MKVSNCCCADGNIQVNVTYNWKDITCKDIELCPKCGEHCEYIEETTFETINTENEQPIESRPGKGTTTNTD